MGYFDRLDNRRTLLVLALSVPLLAACGTESGGGTASDPVSLSGSPALERPTDVPAADGSVRSANLATVMDTGSPELCLGAIAESYPPQCSGPAITNWDWDAQQGVFEQQGNVRWGTFAVTGAWDGTAFTVEDAIPGALYDPAPVDPSEPPAPAEDYSEAELEQMAQDLGDLPGAQGAYAMEGHVFIDVLYDDGSIQAWADEEYGAHVVIITSALVEVT